MLRFDARTPSAKPAEPGLLLQLHARRRRATSLRAAGAPRASSIAGTRSVCSQTHAYHSGRGASLASPGHSPGLTHRRARQRWLTCSWRAQSVTEGRPTWSGTVFFDWLSDRNSPAGLCSASANRPRRCAGTNSVGDRRALEQNQVACELRQARHALLRRSHTPDPRDPPSQRALLALSPVGNRGLRCARIEQLPCQSPRDDFELGVPAGEQLHYARIQVSRHAAQRARCEVKPAADSRPSRS